MEETRCARVAWYVPVPSEEGGGFRTILQNAHALSLRGFSADFYVIPAEGSCIDIEKMASDCLKWFGMAPDRWFIAGAEERERDIAIATAWNTAAWADSMPCKAIFYFVQDYEPWFMPLSADRLEAERSYRKGYACITIGRWLANRIADFYDGASVAYTDFGVSPIYRDEGRERGRKSVCAIFQPEKERRAAPLLMRAIEVALQLDPELTFYLYGSNAHVPINDDRVVSLGIITPQECATLYNRCVCGVSISASNPSRIPFEMMKCGLPVIDLYRKNNLYDHEDGCIRLVEPAPAALASGIVDLISDKRAQDDMRAAALRAMASRTLDGESQRFAELVEEYLHRGAFVSDKPGKLYHSAAFAAGEKTVLLEREFVRTEHKRLREQCVPVYCGEGGLDIQVPTKATYEYLRVACWSQPDQSDIQWLVFSHNDEGYTADLQVRAASLGGGSMMLHFYACEGERDVLLGMVTAPVSTSEGASRKTAVYDVFGERVVLSSRSMDEVEAAGACPGGNVRCGGEPECSEPVSAVFRFKRFFGFKE